MVFMLGCSTAERLDASKRGLASTSDGYSMLFSDSDSWFKSAYTHEIAYRILTHVSGHIMAGRKHNDKHSVERFLNITTQLVTPPSYEGDIAYLDNSDFRKKASLLIYDFENRKNLTAKMIEVAQKYKNIISSDALEGVLTSLNTIAKYDDRSMARRVGVLGIALLGNSEQKQSLLDYVLASEAKVRFDRGVRIPDHLGANSRISANPFIVMSDSEYSKFLSLKKEKISFPRNRDFNFDVITSYLVEDNKEVAKKHLKALNPDERKIKKLIAAAVDFS